MRKIIALFLLFPLLALSVENSRKGAFVGSFGPAGCIMSKAAGGAELWLYPYKILQSFSFDAIMEGSEFSSSDLFYSYRLSPVSFTRLFLHSSFKIEETSFASSSGRRLYIIYRIKNLKPLKLIFRFRPVLQPMWPACIGGKFSFWDSKLAAYIISEASWRNFAVFGCGKGKALGSLPAHKLPGGYVRFQVELEPGENLLVFAAVAGRGKYEKIREEFKRALASWKKELEEREESWRKYLKSITLIETPSATLNKAYLWAASNLHAALVSNPDLGEGLVAGYGLSGESERPGFAWFFGGDAMINSLALLDMGDFQAVRKALSFLLRYQRKDGKIMHELSQGAAFVDWFGSYGFPFFHGDTTLYFVAAFAEYIRRSGDIDFLKKNWKGLEKIYRWMREVDPNEDGIAESAKAGVGASETGPLRQKMHTDILLAGLSVRAWKDMAFLARLAGRKGMENHCRKMAEKASAALEKMFWNRKLSIYAYAVSPEIRQVEELTVWPAIAMSFGVLNRKRGRIFAEKLASPELSTDWGTRFLSSRSRYYDPVSYNNGAVWPFLTGFASLALYRYSNPYAAYDLLLALACNFFTFNPGYATELISGAFYKEIEASVPNQIWSSGNFVAPLVKGLFGIKGDAAARRIELRPAFPLLWEKASLENYRVGKGRFSLRYEREGRYLRFIIKTSGLENFTINFCPLLWIRSRLQRLTVNGREMTPSFYRAGARRGFCLQLPAKEKIGVEVGLSSTGFDPVIEKRLVPGQESQGLRFAKVEEKGESFILYVWGKGEKVLELAGKGKLSCEGCAERLPAPPFTHRFLVKFGKEYTLRRLVFREAP